MTDERARTPVPVEAAAPVAADEDVEAVRQRSAFGMFMIRYGLGSFLVIAGVACLIISPGGFGVEGFSMSAGAGFSVLMLNFLYRLGVSGDRDREREEAARIYLAEHGHWPDERGRVR